MENSINYQKEIPEIEPFAKKIEFELYEYHVYLSAETFKAQHFITQTNIQNIIKEMCPKVKIRGHFPLRTFEEIKNILRPAFSYDLMDGPPELPAGIRYIDVSSDSSFIEKQEQEFWDIIGRHFSLPPKQCFEYEPTEDDAYFPYGTWWEFFVILCNDNQGLVLEGAAYD